MYVQEGMHSLVIASCEHIPQTLAIVFNTEMQKHSTQMHRPASYTSQQKTRLANVELEHMMYGQEGMHCLAIMPAGCGVPLLDSSFYN